MNAGYSSGVENKILHVVGPWFFLTKQFDVY